MRQRITPPTRGGGAKRGLGGAADTSIVPHNALARQATWQTFKEAILEAADFPALFEELVRPLPRLPRNGRGVSVSCFAHDDHRPSMAVYNDHAYCFVCRKTWDAIELVREQLGLDFMEALRWLADRYNVPRPDLSPQALAAIRRRREVDDVLTLAADHLHRRLLETPQALEYAHRRGWDDETIQAAMLGYADGTLAAAIRRAGVSLDHSGARIALSIPKGFIVYPHRQAGRVIYLSGRSITGKKHYNPPRDLAGERRPYFNWLWTPRVQEVIIVEGQACAISLGAWGFPAMALAGSGVTGNLASTLKRYAARGVDFYIVPDADGRTDVAGLVEVLGPLARVVSLPDGVEDINDWHQQGGTAEGMRELLDTAPTWLDVKIIEAAEMPEGPRRDGAIEAMFPLLAQLPPLPLARYKGQVCKALEIRGRDFDRLLRAARQVQEQAEADAAPDVLEGQYPVLNPALDFTDGLAVTTVSLLTIQNGRVSPRPYIITGGTRRELVPVRDEQLITLAGKRVILATAPDALTLGKRPRWEYVDIQRYLKGDSPDPVQVYLGVEYLYDKYVDFREEGASDVLALWVIGTYLYPLFEAYPYIALNGPKGSGKTKVVDLTAKLAFNMVASSNISPAALFRWVAATRGVLAIDEAERLSNTGDPVVQDLRLLLNAGYKRGSPAIRIEGDDRQVTEFEVYGPKMIASIREPEDVLKSRCITIHMLRTTTDKGRRVISEQGENWAGMRHGLYSLALIHYAAIRDLYLEGAGADGLNNRAAELWRPLLAIAAFLDRQGAEGILTLARDYAQHKVTQAEETNLDDWRVALLLALHQLTIEEGRTEVTPGEVREAMTDFLENGVEVSPQWVGYRLKEFGFKRERTRRGSVYITNAQNVLDVMERYGVKKL